jgi:hypothetical protein
MIKRNQNHERTRGSVEELSYGPENRVAKSTFVAKITAATFTSLCGYGKRTTWA